MYKTSVWPRTGMRWSVIKRISAVIMVVSNTKRVRRSAPTRMSNWLIGANIVEFEQDGADRATYGQQLLSRLSGDLERRKIPGCSREMLGRMRFFYRIYPQVSEAVSSPETGILRKRVSAGFVVEARVATANGFFALRTHGAFRRQTSGHRTSPPRGVRSPGSDLGVDPRPAVA